MKFFFLQTWKITYYSQTHSSKYKILTPNPPPQIFSKFKSINKMSEILCRNYEVAKRVRNRQLINNLNNYKNIRHNSNNAVSGDLNPYVGQPIFVDYQGKHNSLKFGIIIEIINSRTVKIKFQDKSIKDIPTKLVYALIIPELGGKFLNKTFPQDNGQDPKPIEVV